MITLQQAMQNVGREVVYRNIGVIDEGIITGVSEIAGLVYVRYSGDEWAKATHPSQLEFTNGGGADGLSGVVQSTAGGPATSAPSSPTGGRATSEVATLPSVPQRKRGETDGYQEARLGLVTSHPEGQQVLGTCSPGAAGTRALLAKEGGLMSHARLGTEARWYCAGCFRKQRQGSFACRNCCGWTGRRAKVATGVTDAFGRPSKRVPS